MIIKVTLYIKNADWIKLMKSMAMKMVKPIQVNSEMKVLKMLS